MAKNPQLTVVQPTATAGEPPRKLGDHGRTLWDRVMTEYDIQDSGGLEMLLQTDNESAAGQFMLQAGMIFDGATGTDDLAIALDLDAQSLGTIKSARLNFEPLRTVGRPPPRGWQP
jgi:hypothetical protein